MRQKEKILFDHLLPTHMNAGIYRYYHSDQSYENHAHHDLEINVILSGSANIAHSGSNYKVGRDHLIILRPMEFHRLSKRSSDFEMLVVVYPSRALNRFIDEEDVIREIMEERSPLIGKLKTGHKERILRLIEEIEEEDISPLLRENLIKSLFVMFFDFYRQAGSLSSSSTFNDSVLVIMSEIKSSGNSLSLKEAADIVQMEPETVSRLFQADLNMGYNQYLNRERLISFMNLYTGGSRNLLHAALKAGFNSYRSFYRVFKNHYGTGPREYFH